MDDPDELMVGVVGLRRSSLGSTRGGGGAGQKGIPHAKRRTHHLRGSVSDVVQKSCALRDLGGSVTEKEERSEYRGEQRPVKEHEERSPEHGERSGDRGDHSKECAATSDGDDKRYPLGE